MIAVDSTLRDIAELITDYERGMYTFGEVVTAILCEAATRDAAHLARDLPAQFLDGIAEAVRSLPEDATAEDVVVLKSSRAHAEQWFNGAVQWRRYFAEQSTVGLGTSPSR